MEISPRISGGTSERESLQVIVSGDRAYFYELCNSNSPSLSSAKGAQITSKHRSSRERKLLHVVTAIDSCPRRLREMRDHDEATSKKSELFDHRQQEQLSSRQQERKQSAEGFIMGGELHGSSGMSSPRVLPPLFVGSACLQWVSGMERLPRHRSGEVVHERFALGEKGARGWGRTGEGFRGSVPRWVDQ